MASFLRNIGNSVLFTLNKTHILQKSFSSPFQIGINEYSKTAKIYESLGLTVPPKKPAGAFMRFSKDLINRNSFSGKRIAERAIILGKKWKELPPAQKQPYQDAYKKDQAIYAKQIEVFRRSLTENDVMAIKNERKRLIYAEAAKKTKIQRREMVASLGRPKKPPSPYILFISESAGTRIGAEMATKWAKMPENEKSVYIKKCAELRAKFDKNIEAWEKQMIAQGNLHLVRGKTVAALNKAGKKSKKE